jgi:GTP-binding protein
MAFIDEVSINITAGRGGDGVVRWRQEKFKPLSGPGGGNGGAGGSVYALAISDVSYLDYYRHSKKFQAQNGDPGDNFSCQGSYGEDLVLKFPIGSIISNKTTGEIFELTYLGEKIKILSGGRGGLGNEHFKNSRNTTPKESTPGDAGETGEFHIQLQLFADVGLVGLPNAGKSSLLNTLTRAKSKIGSYQFTTLDPHLGAFYEFIIADIPGLIEGASDGKGLGVKFLKHINRTNMILHLVSCEEGEAMLPSYIAIKKELEKFNPELIKRPEMILITKTDVLADGELDPILKQFEQFGIPVMSISLYDDESIKKFSDTLVQKLREIQAEIAKTAQTPEIIEQTDYGEIFDEEE